MTHGQAFGADRIQEDGAGPSLAASTGRARQSAADIRQWPRVLKTGLYPQFAASAGRTQERGIERLPYERFDETLSEYLAELQGALPAQKPAQIDDKK
jgi:hypothetical protein